MTPHKHHDLIVAWAKGAQIEYRGTKADIWKLTKEPQWYIDYEYRIKPEEKQYTYHVQWPDGQIAPRWHQKTLHNLQLTFDGETGKLKKAEVINEE